MITRTVNGQTFNLGYDAENRLVTVTGPNSFSATFTYDGDGKRVRSTINGVTTSFIGSHYEVTENSITKYYYAGTSQIAMRKDGVLSYLLSDHLGSNSIVMDASGAVVSQTLYKAWGEERYSSGTQQTNYTYTGQYSYANDFGLMYYGARWYDSSLGRFSQPDSIVPLMQGIQAWDRYAYANNSPLNYVDPSGHFALALPLIVFSPVVVTVATVALIIVAAIVTAVLIVEVAEELIPQHTPPMAGGENAPSVLSQPAPDSSLDLPYTPPMTGGENAGQQFTPPMSSNENLLPQFTPPMGTDIENITIVTWNAGDQINAPTANGNYPSWSTVQSRYWINRAKNALAGEFSESNIERMKNGLAPLHENGASMELHHINGRNIPDPHNINNLVEVWPWEHSDIDPFRHYRGPRPE